MSSKLVCVSDNNQFAGIEPKEGCFDDIKHCALSCLYNDIEISGLVGAHPVVVSSWSVVGNHPLHRLRSQQPWRKDHEGFTKRDAHHVQVQISGGCNESLESHQLLDLEMTIRGVTTICLIDSGSIHIFIDRKMFDKLGL